MSWSGFSSEVVDADLLGEFLVADEALGHWATGWRRLAAGRRGWAGRLAARRAGDGARVQGSDGWDMNRVRLREKIVFLSSFFTAGREERSERFFRGMAFSW